MISKAKLEQMARDICPACQRAYDMERRGEKGHTLRVRTDTGEHVHDFVALIQKDTKRFEHQFCLADSLRKRYGR